MQATQDSIGRGKTAAWTVTVQAENGAATSVTVSLGAEPVQMTPAFTNSCPSGPGNLVCTIGDMGTATTPSSYRLQAQVTIPAGTTASVLAVTASATTSPAMTANPSASQTITITGTNTGASAGAKASPTPARTVATKPATIPTHPVITPATTPFVPADTPPATLPAVGTLPTPDSATTAVAPSSVAVLPQISPVVATAPVSSTGLSSSGLSSPAANVQAADTNPSATADSDAFTISIGMSAQTAQVLGWILLALVITLVASKLVSSHFARTRQPAVASGSEIAGRPASSRRLPRVHLPRPHLSRLRPPLQLRPRHTLRLRPRHTRAERRAIREQNWRRYLESQRALQPPKDATTHAPDQAMPDIADFLSALAYPQART